MIEVLKSRAVVERPIHELKPHDKNPRTHSKRQVEQIAKSIKRFGFVNPVLLDRDGNILAGHGRIEAAKSLGLTAVPTLDIGSMSDAERRAYIVADNRLAELAGWDSELLGMEMEAILEAMPDFDIGAIGFDDGELDALLAAAEAPVENDDIPDVEAGKPAVTRPGDIWQLGNHRIMCGDARDGAALDQLMNGEVAQMIFTDPPYNVKVDGHICGMGSVKHREFAMASGEMSKAEFTDFLGDVLINLARVSSDGSIHFVCMDWRHIGELLEAGEKAYVELKNLVVWNKDNGGMGTFYRSKHELVFVFKNGTAAHINNFGLGEKGRYRTNVWDYAGVNSLKKGRDEELAMHPTVKPVAMVADAIRDCSSRSGSILDVFSGSGATIIAAERTGRRCYAMELDPLYVDVAIRRWQAETGLAAINLKHDASFAICEALEL